MAACSTFANTIELPGLWRRRLGQIHLDSSTRAMLDRELVTRELRRLYIEAATQLHWGECVGDDSDDDVEHSTPSISIKILLCGPNRSGKTSFRARLLDDTFNYRFHDDTIGIDVRCIDCKYCGERLRLHVWDSGGTRSFGGKPTPPVFFTDSDITLCFIDLSHHDGLKSAYPCLDQARAYSPDTKRVVVVGCKMDKRRVGTEQAYALAAKVGPFKYVECSSKTGEGVRPIVARAVKDHYKRLKS